MATVGKTVAYLGIEWHVIGAHSGDPAMRDRILIRRVIADSPAAKAGLRAGDTIKSVDGSPLDKANTLSNIIASHKPGAVIAVCYWRGDKLTTTKITLGERQLPAFKFKPIEESAGRVATDR